MSCRRSRDPLKWWNGQRDFGVANLVRVPPNTVDIVWSGSFSESDLASFNALPDLTYLYFADIGDSEASHLLQCEHMIGLDIQSNRLTLDGIRSLMQMPDLHFVALAGKVWGPELVDVLYESPTLEHVRILDRIWEWWEFEDLRKRLRTQ